MYPNSPDRAEVELIDEIQQELEDVCGWSCVLWAKLQAIKVRLAGGAVGSQRNGPVQEPVAPGPSVGELTSESASEAPFRGSNGFRGSARGSRRSRAGSQER
jgi:hypothetical protein